jgi:hypothetical protein
MVLSSCEQYSKPLPIQKKPSKAREVYLHLNEIKSKTIYRLHLFRNTLRKIFYLIYGRSGLIASA